MTINLNRKGYTRTIILFSIAVYFVAIVFIYYLIGNGLVQYGNPDAVEFAQDFYADTTPSDVSGQYVDCLKYGGYSWACIAGRTVNNELTETSDNPFQADNNPYETKKGTIGFWKAMVISINVFPWWLQTILFAPLVAMFFYLLLTAFIPTINAGQ